MSEGLVVMLYGAVEGERSTPVIVAVDGNSRLRIRDLMVGVGADGVERPITIEDTRELGMSMHGEDPTNDIVGLMTDEQRLLRNRPYEPWRRVAFANLGAGWVTYYTVPANSIAKVRVTFGQNTLNADSTVSLRVQGIGIMIEGPMYAGAPGPSFEFTLQAAEIVEASRPNGLGATIYIAAELYSTGDVNTGV